MSWNYHAICPACRTRISRWVAFRRRKTICPTCGHSLGLADGDVRLFFAVLLVDLPAVAAVLGLIARFLLPTHISSYVAWLLLFWCIEAFLCLGVLIACYPYLFSYKILATGRVCIGCGHRLREPFGAACPRCGAARPGFVPIGAADGAGFLPPPSAAPFRSGRNS